MPLLLPRIQRLLTEEFGLRYDFDKRLVCDARDCTTHLNRGCLVVQLQALLPLSFHPLAPTTPTPIPTPTPTPTPTRTPTATPNPLPSPSPHQELFRYLSETRPYETYVVTLPDAVA